MSKYNWQEPDKKKSASRDSGCGHADADEYRWHVVQSAPREGYPTLAFHMVFEKLTKTCTSCGWVETKNIGVHHPDEEALKHRFRGKVSPEMLNFLKALDAKESPLVETQTPKKSSQDEHIQEAFAPHMNDTETDTLAPPSFEEDEASAVTAAPSSPPEPEAAPAPAEKTAKAPKPKAPKTAPVETSESRSLDTAKQVLAREFWKQLKSGQAILRSLQGQGPFPFTNPNSMFHALMEETHEITGAHGVEGLKAWMLRNNKRLAETVEDVENFTKLLLNTGGDWSDRALAIAENWKVRRLENDETWIVFNSNASYAFFDAFLGIPHEEIYPPEWREGAAPRIPEVTAPAQSPEPAAEVQETTRKIKENTKKEAAARLPPVTSVSAQENRALYAGGDLLLTSESGTSVQLSNMTPGTLRVKIIQLPDRILVILGAG